ncbi:MAG TPA: trypsin-like peptidase domain-containing protein [Mycobacteriales bacterium]|nr:trypsin-like peptidase domain-containing protein [Mycobacteriales bacterium]
MTADEPQQPTTPLPSAWSAPWFGEPADQQPASSPQGDPLVDGAGTEDGPDGAVAAPSPRHRPSRRVAGVAVVAVAAASVGAVGVWAADDRGSKASATVQTPTAQTDPAPVSSTDGGVKKALAAIEPSVVLVTTTIGSSNQGSNGFFPGFGGGFQGSGAGTGIVLSGSEVVTNAHVVADATSINVQTPDGARHAATVEGSDSQADLAVLKVTGVTDMKPAQWAASSTAQVGDAVIAVGNAEGYGGTPSVSEGIISALGRTISDDTSENLTGLIQTDAAINPGNSGGPLVDTAGRVVGITTAVERGSTNEPAQGIGFAIPSDTVLKAVPALRKGQSVQQASGPIAYLGVNLEDGPTGPQVTDVGNGTPAEKAGVKAGDVIQQIDGTALQTSTDLQAAIRSHKPGDTVKLGIVRNGATDTVTVTLGTRPSVSS